MRQRAPAWKAARHSYGWVRCDQRVVVYFGVGGGPMCPPDSLNRFELGGPRAPAPTSNLNHYRSERFVVEFGIADRGAGA